VLVKVAQIVADELGIEVERVKSTATSTARVPNTSATAASASSDLNGAAAADAARRIRARLASCAASHLEASPADVVFEAGRVRAGARSLYFEELAAIAHRERISLSATGFYRTPEIGCEPGTLRGRPFLYFANGAAVSEVVVDTLTGETRLVRVDILHDCGRSLNPAIDVGQIEGGFVQGLGWLTTEDLCWDRRGRLLTHSPSTYKIPVAADAPIEWHVDLFDGAFRDAALHRSKAVGEPPLMLAISAFHAIRDAIASIAPAGATIPLDAPATPERILFTIRRMRGAVAAGDGARGP
jgi:xanthine dehydrogenase large subunit